MVLLDKEQIMEIIPHRDPFLFVDEVTALEPGKKCVARRIIDENDFWFSGHFPSYPITPQSIILEMLMQTNAICTGSIAEYKGKIAYFSKMDKVRFRRQVSAGETITLTVDIDKLKGNSGTSKAVAAVNNEIVCTAELTFIFKK